MSKRPWFGGQNHHLQRSINCPGIIIIIFIFVVPSVLIIPRVKNIKLKTDWATEAAIIIIIIVIIIIIIIIIFIIIITIVCVC